MNVSQEAITKAVNKAIASGAPRYVNETRLTTFQGHIEGRAWGGFDGKLPVSFTVKRNAGDKNPLAAQLRNMAGDFQPGGREFSGYVTVRRIVGNGRYVVRERFVSGNID